jgi:phytoene synthase
MPQPLPDLAAGYAADVAACRKLLSCGSRTFFAASFLLPSSIRGPASVLYAFCRLADDAVDVEDDGAAGLLNMRERLDRAYAGRPLAQPADRAFAHVVAKFAMPRELPEALLEGFEWDVLGRRYDTFAELQDYAARVAGAVGAMMAVLMGVRAPAVVARACDLGVAMQLSNIARDVGEDARLGRLYLPRQWLADAGLDPDAWLQQPVHCKEIASVIERLLCAADAIYDRVDAGIGRLPSTCRPGIRAARLLYAEIGHEVKRHAFDSVSRRAVVPRRRKAKLLARALLSPATPEPKVAPPPLEAVRFLVDALVPWGELQQVWLGGNAPALPWWNFGERVGWAIELFGQLEQREKVLPATRRQIQPMWTEPNLPSVPWWNHTERMGWVIELFGQLDGREKRQKVRSVLSVQPQAPSENQPQPVPAMPKKVPAVALGKLSRRVGWVIELFDQLEQRDRLQSFGTRP